LVVVALDLVLLHPLVQTVQTQPLQRQVLLQQLAVVVVDQHLINLELMEVQEVDLNLEVQEVLVLLVKEITVVLV
jgi:hypothetical protein